MFSNGVKTKEAKMFKKVLAVVAVLGLAGFQFAGCGKQTSGLNTTSVNQTSEESINSSANDSIALSSVSNDQSLGVMGYESLLGGSSCPSVTKTHETTAGIYPSVYLVTINFGNGCIPANYFRGVMTSGEITMTVTLFSDSTTNQITMTTISAVKNIVKTRQLDQASLYISGTTDIVKTLSGSGASATITRTISVNETQIALTGVGRLVMDHDVVLNFTMADTGAWPNITQRVINGTGSVDHLLLKVLATATLTNFTYAQGCCHPVGGSIVLVLTSDKDNSTIGTYDLSYAGNNQCSDVASLNGKQISLNPCD